MSSEQSALIIIGIESSSLWEYDPLISFLSFFALLIFIFSLSLFFSLFCFLFSCNSLFVIIGNKYIIMTLQ